MQYAVNPADGRAGARHEPARLMAQPGLLRMRVAVLVKQVPRFEVMALADDGRLNRSAVDLELNPYCRRAVSKGVDLVREYGGECVVFTLGPPAADDALREAVAWGADRAVHLCDPAFAGSDTLATARALAAALRREGKFDLFLVGKCSVDADTGQVGPEVAQLLGLPMLAGARELDIEPDRRSVWARCEWDDGYVVRTTTLPALVSTAERLCEPAKVPPEGRGAVAPGLISRVYAESLGTGPWGVAASPTAVGELRSHEVIRRKTLSGGPLETQIGNLVSTLKELGVLGRGHVRPKEVGAVPPAASTRDSGRRVVVYLEPGRPEVARELLGQAAATAADICGRVIALTWEPDLAATHACWGADLVVPLKGSRIEQNVAAALAQWCDERRPWALLLPGTMSGREIGGRIAAELKLGLTGDAVDLTVDSGVLVAWKPSFGGQFLAAITSSSDIQMVTIRPGVLPLRASRLRAASAIMDAVLDIAAQSPTVQLDMVRDDDVELLSRAEVVLAIGSGVPPERYDELEPLRRILGAELGATRKVTDKGWMPRARQVGITGRSISPRLFVSIGASGKFNHVVGARGAHFVVAINNDPKALIFESSDIGIVGDWREAIPLLTEKIAAELTTTLRYPHESDVGGWPDQIGERL